MSLFYSIELNIVYISITLHGQVKYGLVAIWYETIVRILILLENFKKNIKYMIRCIVIVALGTISYVTLSSFEKIAYRGQQYRRDHFCTGFLGAIILWAIAVYSGSKLGPLN